jgi:hypothetical protein
MKEGQEPESTQTKSDDEGLAAHTHRNRGRLESHKQKREEVEAGSQERKGKETKD